MLNQVQHDKQKYVIPNLFRNLEFGHEEINCICINVLSYLRRKQKWRRSFSAKGI